MTDGVAESSASFAEVIDKKEEELVKEKPEGEKKKEGKREVEIDYEGGRVKPTRFASNAALELTAACNHRCIFCSNVWKGAKGIKRPFDRAELTTEEWIRTIDLLLELGIKSFMITGGEPTLHKGFKEIIRHCVERNQREGGIDIVTNGETTMFDDDEYCKWLADNGVAVSVSIHGGPERHAFAIGREDVDSLPRTIETMRHLSSAGVYVVANIVVGGSGSIAHSMDAARLAVEQGGAHQLLAMRPIQSGSGVVTSETPDDVKQFIECTAEEYRVAYMKLARYARRKGVLLASGCSTPECILPSSIPDIECTSVPRGCACGSKYVAIDPQGWLRPCTTACTMGGHIFDPSSGVITREAIVAAFESEEMDEFRFQALPMSSKKVVPEKCVGCEFLSSCSSGCPSAHIQCSKDSEAMCDCVLVHDDACVQPSKPEKNK